MLELRGFLWLTGFLLLGEALVIWLGLPISSGVIGMLALTSWLILRGHVSVAIKAASQPLITLLAMLIMPGVVGVFFIVDAFAGQWLAVGVALILGTLASVATTFWFMQRFMPRETSEGRAEQ
ncbi:CidA/LrgA family protein [Halomonas urumqiensis]|uniref:CidA/LrgA family protein n=1 Tax=Halomonas urumqiensis TaxID=1684789 RepID=A0A2N7UKH5_9GAMM|nr:CidA/LrgA family protein [Halomonas urumqiensis]PMR80950.1 CidA/LrgA family protein [Halomonas urumqiensis]PTB02907.1 CidA/LrgA family protein [Halomonas urumqiensis]GHE21433.1 hypothetical protein GCM10017767_19540 [Halomonas urumqiensis]